MSGTNSTEFVPDTTQLPNYAINYSQARSNLRSAKNHRTTLVSKNTAPFLREGVLTWPGLTAGAAGFLPGTVCHTWRIWMVQPDPEGISLVTKLPELAL